MFCMGGVEGLDDEAPRRWCVRMKFDEFAKLVGRTIVRMFVLAMFVFVFWVSTWPCSEVNRRTQEQWCSPPSRSIGRAGAYAISDWWDGVVIWQ